jgi:hypothetical protein
MNTNRAAYSFVALGFASLAGGIACLGWASSLGGFRFVGATAAIFLAMLSFLRVAELRRSRIDVRAIPMPDSKCDSIHAPLIPSRRDMEDAELAAKLAALRIRRQEVYEAEEAEEADDSRIAPLEPDLGVTVIEGPPLEPEPDPLLAAPAIEPEPVPQLPTVGLRQMDELRAEIARLREGARLRQAGLGAGVSAAPPGFMASASQAGDSFPRTEFSGLPGSEPAESFERTEFTGLGAAPSEGTSFTKTEFLGPIELRR